MRKGRIKQQGSSAAAPQGRGLTNGLLYFSQSLSDRGGKTNGGFHLSGFINGSSKGRVNGRINGRTNGKTNGRVNGRINGFTNGKVNGLTNGRVNGLTNGRRSFIGLINGLTNGLVNGITNGRRAGKTNGIVNGFVNGSGRTNGYRLTSRGRRLAPGSLNLRRKLIAASILVILAVAIPYYLVYTMPQEQVEIDGYFMDWLDAQIYNDIPDSDNPDTSLEAYAVKRDFRGTYFYIRTEGIVLNGVDEGADGFYIFIDRDSNPATGYSVRELGADALIELIGWNETVMRGNTMIFRATADKLDFGGFETVNGIEAASYKGEIEISTPLFVNDRSKFAVCSIHTDTPQDWSDVNYRKSGPALEIFEDHDGPDVLSAFVDRHLLSIEISNKGSSTAIRTLNFDFLGNVTPLSISAVRGHQVLGSSAEGGSIDFQIPVGLDRGDSVDIEILATVPYDSVTGSVGIQLNRSDPIGKDGNVTWHIRSLQTGSRVSYISSAPSGIVIDGAFGDWATKVPIQDALGDAFSNKTGDMKSGDVDLHVVKVASSADVASFYLSVNGTMLGGSSVPSEMVRWVTPGEPAENVTNITEPMYGSDFAFVFIDTDRNSSSGYHVGGSEISIGIVGKGNQIISSKVYRFNQSAWEEIGNASSAIDLYQLEIGSSYSLLGLVPGLSYSITFVAQDWSGRQDDLTMPLVARATAGTRAFGGIMINELNDKKKTGDSVIELYNTGTTPINIGGWQLWVDGNLVFMFPDVTIQPGTLYVMEGLEFDWGLNYVLVDSSGATVDQANIDAWQMGKSYGRIGPPPYSTWAWGPPSPGRLNKDQVEIPEFSDLLFSLAIIPIVLLAIRRAGKRKGARELQEGRQT